MSESKQGISKEDLDIMIFALRYTTGRHTYAPQLVCDYIIERIPRMEIVHQEMVLYEVLKIIGYNAIDPMYSDYVRLRCALQDSLEATNGEK